MPVSLFCTDTINLLHGFELDSCEFWNLGIDCWWGAELQNKAKVLGKMMDGQFSFVWGLFLGLPAILGWP
jgi:hypothetical protein